MHLIYVGEMGPYSHSYRRLVALEKLGFEVLPIDIGYSPKKAATKLVTKIMAWQGYPLDLAGANQAILAAAASGKYNLLWVDNATAIKPATLAAAKKLCPSLFRVLYTSDDPFGQIKGQYRRMVKTIPHYELHFVPREKNISEYLSAGAPLVLRHQFSFCPELQRPMSLTTEEKQQWGNELLFIGHWEEDREECLAALIKAGLPVRVIDKYWRWRLGKHWKLIKPHFVPGPVWGDDYARALGAAKISLGFLSKWANDTVTTRTYEIPACGGFLLAEHSEESVRLFAPGKEAEFFASPEELIEKARYYLEHSEERERIARAGLERCRRSGYDHPTQLRQMLGKVMAISGWSTGNTARILPVPENGKLSCSGI
jgi:hypothetical protein